MEVDHWITTREAAEISGYHVNYVRRLIRRGKIEAEKKGVMWWVDWDSLRAYVEDSQAKDDGRFVPK